MICVPGYCYHAMAIKSIRSSEMVCIGGMVKP